MNNEGKAFVAYGLMASVSFGLWHWNVFAGIFCAMAIILIMFLQPN